MYNIFCNIFTKHVISCNFIHVMMSRKSQKQWVVYQLPGTIGRTVGAYKSLNNLTGWQSPFHELGWPALIPLFYVLSWELRWYNRFSSCLCFTRWKQWWSCEVGLVVLFCQVNYNSTILHSITVSPTDRAAQFPVLSTGCRELFRGVATKQISRCHKEPTRSK